MRVDLNSDLGESFGAWKMGDDDAMLGIVTSASVACGWHAGDPVVMHRACEMAKKNGVAIGAHPSFNDLWGFGRRVIRGTSFSDLEKQIAYQIGALQGVAAMVGHKVTHVKAHGALGNLINDEDDFAMAHGARHQGGRPRARLYRHARPADGCGGREARYSHAAGDLRRPRLPGQRPARHARPAGRHDPRRGRGGASASCARCRTT